eukprot:Skav216362  [mRNA]  locus=scaffold1517:16977:19973:+ [translate_table: standard]
MHQTHCILQLLVQSLSRDRPRSSLPLEFQGATTLGMLADASAEIQGSVPQVLILLALPVAAYKQSLGIGDLGASASVSFSLIWDLSAHAVADVQEQLRGSVGGVCKDYTCSDLEK